MGVISNQILPIAFFTLFVGVSAHIAGAKTLDTWGNVYEIKEKDMRELVRERARKFNFKAWKESESARLQEILFKYRPEAAVSGLPPSIEGGMFKVDLSFTLKQDILDLNGNVIYPKGFVYNPLELMNQHGAPFSKILVVLNGTRMNEIQWFKKKFPNYKEPHIKLLITDGSAFEVAERVEKKTQYLTNILKDKFVISETPSVIVQIPGEKFLTVKMYRVDNKGNELPDIKKSKPNVKKNNDKTPVDSDKKFKLFEKKK